MPYHDTLRVSHGVCVCVPGRAGVGKVDGLDPETSVETVGPVHPALLHPPPCTDTGTDIGTDRVYRAGLSVHTVRP